MWQTPLPDGRTRLCGFQCFRWKCAVSAFSTLKPRTNCDHSLAALIERGHSHFRAAGFQLHNVAWLKHLGNLSSTIEKIAWSEDAP
jgi:hypothetical protein